MNTPGARELVVLVGGYMHGSRALVPRPEERMTLETRRGEWVEYVCRLRRSGVVDGRSTRVALYAPDSLTDMEFDVLAAHAMPRLHSPSTYPSVN